MLPVGVVDDVGGLVCIHGCRVSSLSTKYLGLSLAGFVEDYVNMGWYC